jgi:uncharacterized membrane protein
MAESKKKSKRLIEIVLTIFIVVGIGLIMADMVTNVIYEINSSGEFESAVQEVEPTPVPTLTAEERKEILSAPVGEEGGE